MDPSAAEIIDLYERHARAFDADRSGKTLVERAWLDRFRGVAGEGASVLDLGCGAGEPMAAVSDRVRARRHGRRQLADR